MKSKRECLMHLFWGMVILVGMLSVALSAQTIPRLTVGETSDADQLNPFTNFSSTGSYVNEYLFFSLLRTDKATGEFVPLLAEALPSISSDLLSYTYKVHPLAKFNNGKRVTARDVVFSFKVLRNPFVNNSQKRVHYDAVADVIVLDERTVMFELKKTSAQGLRITGEFAILSEDHFDPERTLDAVTISEEGMGDLLGMQKVQILRSLADRINIYGSSFAAFDPSPTCGSYSLQNWKRGAEIVLVANKHFWGKKLEQVPNDFFKQNVEEIRIEIYSDESQMRKAIFENHFDIVSSMPQKLFANLNEIPALSEKYQFLSPPGQSYEYIGLNIRAAARKRNPATSDVAVRRAIAHLVNVDLLAVQVCYGLGTRIASDAPAGRPDYLNTDLPLIPFDPTKATQLLEAAGWNDTDGNGLRDKNIQGEEVQIVLECIYNDNKADRQAIAEHLAENAMKVGILIVPTPLPWKTYLARLKSGDFEIAIGAWVSDPNEDTYSQIWHSKSWGKGSNFVGFGSKESDAQVESYDETVEPSQHREISKQIQKSIYDQQPYVFLWANNQCLALNKRYSKAPIYNLRPGFWLAAWE
jgi:peptide/nickel transport system substrate-binding protein